MVNKKCFAEQTLFVEQMTNVQQFAFVVQNIDKMFLLNKIQGLGFLWWHATQK